MARPTLDEQLLNISAREEKRKRKLEIARNVDKKIEAELSVDGTVDVQRRTVYTSRDKVKARYAGESAEPQRNEQAEPEPDAEDNNQKDRSDEAEPDDESQEKAEDNNDDDEDEGDQGDEDENPEDEESEAEPDKDGLEDATEAAEGEESLAAGEAATGAEAAAGAEAGGAAAAGAGAGAGAGAAAGGAAAAGAATASAPIWGTVLAVVVGILLFMALVFIVLISVVAKCNEDSWSGKGARVASSVASWAGVIPEDVCKHLTFNGGASGGGGASGSWTNASVVITSAYRPGAVVAGTNRLSAHGRGEAIDIALRNPVYSPNDSRVAELLQLARSVGFAPPAGDALDEYTNPTEGASGGHVHLEFNTNSSNVTFCDNTPVKNPPTDLVSIPASIPIQGASDPRLRPCMLEAVTRLFNAIPNSSSQ